jgi:omega-amidase
MAMIAARQGCIAMIYPSAFKYVPRSDIPHLRIRLTLDSTTTGPVYWTLLQRARYAILLIPLYKR